ncbi:MAG TPA: hypothetical protein VHD81_12790 [Mycobacteriales bacterium]|nr:hypothetical protein [Mycobacteriales bacterium]
MLASVIGGFALAVSIVANGSGAGASPGLPTSTVATFGDHTAHYCVSGYAANAPVAVHNDKTGDDASIRTNNRGSGCTDVKVAVECGQQVVQSIVASGVAADGNPGTSTAEATVPGNLAPCDSSDGSIAAGPGSSSPSRIAQVSIAIGGAGGLALVAFVVILVRRRRSTATG